MLSLSERLSNYHTCFKSPVVSRFELSEYVAIHLYSSIVSAATMPEFGGVVCGTGMGLKFTCCICACTYRTDLKPRSLGLQEHSEEHA